MVVWQVRHWKVSKFAKSSRDLLACMATPQSGQWRMAGAARREIMLVSWTAGAARRLIQIKTTAVTPPQRCLLNLIYLNAGTVKPLNVGSMWREISTAPFDRDLELAVLDGEGPHALVFPCRRIVAGWMNAGTRERH